jgi:hypothetical protein
MGELDLMRRVLLTFLAGQLVKHVEFPEGQLKEDDAH